MKQLRPQDAQFLYMETVNNLANATMLCIYSPPEGEVDFDAYQTTVERIDSRLHLSPIFTHIIKQLPGQIDYPYWVVDPYFRLPNHLFKEVAPPPADWAQLAEIFAGIHSRPLDLRRPPWEIHVVTGLDNLPDCPANSFALITKIHHAAIDGTSAMVFFQALHDRLPKTAPPGDREKEPSPAPNLSHGAPGPQALLSNATRNYFVRPIQAIGSVLKQSKASLRSRHEPREAADDPQSPIPNTRFNQAVGPRKTFAATHFPMQELKALRALVYGATLNDILLAICGGALHRYLLHWRQLPNIPLAAWVPINARVEADGDVEGNNISAMAIRIGSQINDPRERLEHICRATRDAKSGRSGSAARMVTDLTQTMPAAGMAALTRLVLGSSMTAKMCNLAISNVPGAPFPMYLQGAKCLRQYGMVPLSDGMGLFIVAMSYDGNMSLSITSTEEILPDKAFFVQCLEDEFADMLTRLAPPSVKPKAPRRKAARKSPKTRQS